MAELEEATHRMRLPDEGDRIVERAEGMAGTGDEVSVVGLCDECGLVQVAKSDLLRPSPRTSDVPGADRLRARATS